MPVATSKAAIAAMSTCSSLRAQAMQGLIRRGAVGEKRTAASLVVGRRQREEKSAFGFRSIGGWVPQSR